MSKPKRSIDPDQVLRRAVALQERHGEILTEDDVVRIGEQAGIPRPLLRLAADTEPEAQEISRERAERIWCTAAVLDERIDLQTLLRHHRTAAQEMAIDPRYLLMALAEQLASTTSPDKNAPADEHDPEQHKAWRRASLILHSIVLLLFATMLHFLFGPDTAPEFRTPMVAVLLPYMLWTCYLMWCTYTNSPTGLEDVNLDYIA